MKTCTYCGSQNRDNNNFCSFCGQQFISKPTCTKCGAVLEGNFCDKCGTPAPTHIPASNPTPTPTSIPVPTPTPAPVPNPSQPTYPTSGYQITFMRPNAFQMVANSFHILVDGSARYELKNNAEIKIMMSPGEHSITISVFGVPKKKRFNFQATGHMTLVCKPNPSQIATLWAAPVKVTDTNGREY